MTGESLMREGDVVLDITLRKCWAGDSEVKLSQREFKLLQALLENAGQPMEYRRLAEKIWGSQVTDFDMQRSVIRLAGTLRKKIPPRYVRNMYGVGYMLRQPEKERKRGGRYLKLGPVCLDTEVSLCWVGDKRVSLTPKEFDLLCYFMAHPGVLLTYRDILGAVWGRAGMESNDFETLGQLVSSLRGKVKGLILTAVSRQGYILQEPFAEAAGRAVGAENLIQAGSARLVVPQGRYLMGGKKVALTHDETALLAVLMRRPGVILSSQFILEEAFGSCPSQVLLPADLRRVVKRLRRKLNGGTVLTAWGYGYAFFPPE